MDELAEPRRAAIQRLKAKRDFKAHLVAYVIVNAFLIGIWAMNDGSYFWPFWTLAGWGIGLAFHFWDAYLKNPITEAEIDREMRRGG